MRLIFLGTGGYHPNERRHTAGLLAPDHGIAFDAGTGTFRLCDRLNGSQLDLFLSHAHLDHVCGLTYLLVPRLLGRLTRLTVHGRPQDLAAVRQHLFSEALFPVLPEMELRPLEPEIEVGGGVIRHAPLVHPGGSVGFRFDGPTGSFAYVTDTYVDGSYTEFVRGVDLLIHECYFSDSQDEWALKTGHSHTSQVARLAAEAGVGALCLTHIDPRAPGDDPVGLSQARKIFPRTTIAEDLDAVMLTPRK